MISLEFFKYKWYNTIYACVAQPVVQLIRNEQVACSSHVTSSKRQVLRLSFLFCRRRNEIKIHNAMVNFYTQLQKVSSKQLRVEFSTKFSTPC